MKTGGITALRSYIFATYDEMQIPFAAQISLRRIDDRLSTADDSLRLRRYKAGRNYDITSRSRHFSLLKPGPAA